MSTPLSEPLVLPSVEGMLGLSDDEVLTLQGELASLRRRVDGASAAVAGEIARRSAPELGKDGLARQRGARTPEVLVSLLTGVSGSEARDLVRVGCVLGGEAAWLSQVAGAVEAGDLSVGAAAAIRVGLGEPSADVAADDLMDAATRLVHEAAGLPPERVAERARDARDRLDEKHVAEREALLRGKRSLRMWRQADGTTKLVAVFDAENAAFVADALDRVIGPRTRGVRFVDPAEQARAEAIQSDERTTEQIAVDAFLQMIHAAAQVDDGTIFGSRAPSVRVTVSYADLVRDAGFAQIEGQSTSVSISTAKRIICTTGIVPVVFDPTGRAIDVANDQRLHSARQRIAIAARDGGCLIPWCDRPPSWSEIHHPDLWSEGGKTTVANGVCLCRAHHGWVHDTARRIVLDRGVYHLLEPDGRRIPLPSKSKVARSHAA